MRTPARSRTFTLAALTTAAAAAALTIGATLALFSATETGGTNTFASGTVEVGENGASTTCSVSGMMPGDSSSNHPLGSKTLTPCNYKVKYVGSASAYLAVDILVTAGTKVLYDGSDLGLQFNVATGTGLSLMSGTKYKNSSNTATTVTAGTAATNLLLSKSAAVTNDTWQFDVNYLLPIDAPNSFQGSTATITLTFHAVQAANQSVASCTAGSECTAISWS